MALLYTKGADPQALGFYKMMLAAEMGGKASSIQLLDLTPEDKVKAESTQSPDGRTMKLVRTGSAARLDGFLLAGDTSAEAWIKTLLQDSLPAQSYGRLLLVPGSKAPVEVADAAKQRGRQVCTCFNVTDAAITSELGRCQGTAGERLASLQKALQCGTNCGSCVPQLQRMVRATLKAVAV